MATETEQLRNDLERDIVEARRLANWSSHLTNVLITLALVGGAASGAVLAFAPEWPRWVAGVLAIAPGVAMALQGKLFERRIHHHRMKEVAYQGLLDQLVYEGVKLKTVSRRRRGFRALRERLAEGGGDDPDQRVGGGVAQKGGPGGAVSRRSLETDQRNDLGERLCAPLPDLARELFPAMPVVTPPGRIPIDWGK